MGNPEASVFELKYRFDSPLLYAAYRGDPDILDVMRFAGGFVRVNFFSRDLAEGISYGSTSTPPAERPPFIFACLGMELDFDRQEILTDTTTALAKWLQLRGLGGILPSRVNFEDKGLRGHGIPAGQNIPEETTEYARSIIEAYAPAEALDTDLLIQHLLDGA